MKIATWIRKVLSCLVFLNIAKRYQERSALIKIKAAQTYVLGIKKLRILFLGIVGSAAAFLFLASGLALIHEGIFTYSFLSQQTRFILILVLGVIEVLGAVSIFYYLFREETWMKFTEISKIIETVIESPKKE